MKQFILILLFTTVQLFGQTNQKEFDLIKSYKNHLIKKDLDATIQTLKDLIELKNGNTQYQISLGYIYQLKGKQQLANAHLINGRAFVLLQLSDNQLSPKQVLDHVVALCFAGYEKDCLTVYNQKRQIIQLDQSLAVYDFATIQQLAQQQRKVLQSYFVPTTKQ